MHLRGLSDHPNLAAALLDERATRVGAADRFEDALIQFKLIGNPPADGLALIDGVEGIALSWISFRRVPATEVDADSLPALTSAITRQKYDEASFKRSIGALIEGWRLRRPMAQTQPKGLGLTQAEAIRSLSADWI
ncbi:hypothetical protein [Mycolicibacterium mucogenicum]|uniref:hypothetical protein n=1 Tax=Mycolicibacterium mucogenicum TaxID=56689 RepID=UPI001A95D78B|nr:hypothetical protein [Mycolicibacterium mucogenicum]